MTTLNTRLTDLATRAASQDKTLKTLINGNASDLTALTTTAKGNIVLAVNEVNARVATEESARAAIINDGSPATNRAWSSSKTNTEISNAVAAVVASSPAALDTLNELAAALGNDANFATTISTGLGFRVRVDTATQGLTTGQKSNAITNIGAVASSDIGNPDVDLVSVFNAGLI